MATEHKYEQLTQEDDKFELSSGIELSRDFDTFISNIGKKMITKKIIVLILLTTLINGLISPLLLTGFTKHATSDIDYAVRCIIGYFIIKIIIGYISDAEYEESLKNGDFVREETRQQMFIWYFEKTSSYLLETEGDETVKRKVDSLGHRSWSYVHEVITSIPTFFTLFGNICFLCYAIWESLFIFVIAGILFVFCWFNKFSLKYTEYRKVVTENGNKLMRKSWSRRRNVYHDALHQNIRKAWSKIRTLNEKNDEFWRKFNMMDKWSQFVFRTSVIISSLLVCFVFLNFHVCKNICIPFITNIELKKSAEVVGASLLLIGLYLININNAYRGLLRSKTNYDISKAYWNDAWDAFDKLGTRDEVPQNNNWNQIIIKDFTIKKTDRHREFTLHIPYLEINLGVVFLLKGKFGCGKTTLNRLLSGSDHKGEHVECKGSIIIDGKETKRGEYLQSIVNTRYYKRQRSNRGIANSTPFELITGNTREELQDDGYSNEEITKIVTQICELCSEMNFEKVAMNNIHDAYNSDDDLSGGETKTLWALRSKYESNYGDGCRKYRLGIYDEVLQGIDKKTAPIVAIGMVNKHIENNQALVITSHIESVQEILENDPRITVIKFEKNGNVTTILT